jgi:hypothetical protein
MLATCAEWYVCCWQLPALTAAKAVDIASAATKQHKAAAAIPLPGICAKAVYQSVERAERQRCKLVVVSSAL